MKSKLPRVSLLALYLVSAAAVEAVADPTPAPTPAPPPTPTSAYARVSYGQIFRRQQGCPDGTYMCSGEGFGGICCGNGQVCGFDESEEPACCPSGAVCTGTAPSSAGPAPSEATSFVQNSYFPFPYVATSMEQEECYSAVSQCSENYDTCVSELGGGNGDGDDDDDYQVTIVVPGGNGDSDGDGDSATTIVADHPDVGTSATPICSSLSSQACYELESSHCDEPTTVNGVTIESDSAASGGIHGSLLGAVAAVGAGLVALMSRT